MHAAAELRRIAREARPLERRAAQSDKRESLVTLACAQPRPELYRT